MQKCFSQYPTVYNRSGDNDDDDDFPIMDGPSHIEPESNVDTVDQLEETEKTPSTQTTEQTDKPTKQ